MDFGTLQTIFWFLVLLSIVVFVHEWGHFYVARRNGVRVDVFSVGFGPELFGWYDKRGTRWRVSAVPLGGYVKMFGMAEDGDDDKSAVSVLERGAGDGAAREGELTEDEKKVSFSHKTVGQRAAIVFAGPAINFIFAILILMAIGIAVGVPRVTVAVEEVLAGSAAERAGVQNGDVLREVDGTSINDARRVQQIVSDSAGRDLPMVVLRDGREMTLTVTPEAAAAEEGGAQIGRVGIRMQSRLDGYERLNPISAAWFGIERTAGITWEALVNIGNLFRGQGNFKDLGGPIAIAQMSGQAAEQGVLQFIFFMAVISINLGLINLFPIPVLDGGHLLFMGIEAVRGKPLGERAQEYGFRIGLALVLLLMISVTWNDIARSFGF